VTSRGINNAGGSGQGWWAGSDLYTSPYFDSFVGSLFLFDTGAMGSSAVILSAIETLNSPYMSPSFYWSYNLPYPSFTIVASSPASNTTVSPGDITTFGSIYYCDTPVPITSFVGSNTPVSWNFNMSGLAAISKTGITKTALRDTVYDIPNVAPTGLSGLNGYVVISFSSTPGTAYDPKLVIVWSTGGTGSGGYESEISIRNVQPTKSKDSSIDVLPSIKFPSPGIWGMEQSLPPLHQIPFTRCEPVVVFPSPSPLPVLTRWGWDMNLPLPYRKPPFQPAYNDILKSISAPSLEAWQFEPALPPQWKKPSPQASPVDLLPLAPRKPWGWEPWPAPLYKAPPLRGSFVDPLPRIRLPAWGYEQSLPPLHLLATARSPCYDLFPSTLRPRTGWETHGPSQFRIPHLQPSFSDVLPASLAGGAGWETTGGDRHGFFGSREIDLAVLSPVPFGAKGFETIGPSQYKNPILPPVPIDIFPGLLAGLSGWETSGLPPSRLPFVQFPSMEAIAGLLSGAPSWESTARFPSFRPATFQFPFADVLPSMVMKAFGWEEVGSLPFRPGIPQFPFSDVLPGRVAGPFGWESSESLPLRPSTFQPPLSDIMLSIPLAPRGWEIEVLPGHRIGSVQPPAADLFPAALAHGSWGWEFDNGILRPPGQRIVLPDDWWAPAVPPVFRPTGGGYKPWYGWGYPEIYEDDDLRERLERNLYEIDEQLAALAAEEEEERRGTRIIVPELLPPGWQDDGQGDWKDEVRDRRQRREEDRARQEQPDPYRHVHYNFASDLDFGVRRRIIGILDRAEHRNVNILGSEAFRTREDALVRGSFVGQGTNAWVVRLDAKARLEIAREAVAEGFRLLSFDDTSLSFIHRPTFPWKPVLLGAGAGATIMGAGIFTGWLIWGRTPRK
jgi:hypothetical protein